MQNSCGKLGLLACSNSISAAPKFCKNVLVPKPASSFEKTSIDSEETQESLNTTVQKLLIRRLIFLYVTTTGMRECPHFKKNEKELHIFS